MRFLDILKNQEINYSEKEIKEAYQKLEQIQKEISEKISELEEISDKYGLKVELNDPCSGLIYRGKGYHPAIDPNMLDYYDDLDDIEDHDPLESGYWIPSRICYEG